jgi:SIR2-like domain
MTSDKTDELLVRYPRYIAFLRGQNQKSQLRLVFGAGVSMPIAFPSWGQLVDRIAQEANAKGLIEGKVSVATLTSKVQYLYENFIRNQFENTTFNDDRFKREEARARWNAILRECLYRDAKGVENHPYLGRMKNLIQRSKFVINYNFDDSIEKLISSLVPDEDRDGKKPFETIWSLNTRLKEDVLTIYHPNGFIPSHRHDYASDRIVFSDESFSNQIIGEAPGSQSFVHHFLQNTCLLFGISLDDVSLRQHLRRLALMAPGLNHVLVAHFDPTKPYSEEQQAAISAANFEVYNLLTMFLTTEDISSLCELLTEDGPAFHDRAARLGVPVKFAYYITGGVAAGKTTAVGNFGSCYLYDEWVENSPDVISKPYTSLTDSQKREADDWIGRQFGLKNRALRNSKEGIHVADRAPLDPLSFETESVKKRAADLEHSIRPGASKHKLEEGQVILLQCPEPELRRRLISKSKFWSEDTIGKNVHALQELYGPTSFIVDSYATGVAVTAKDISRLIFLQPYRPTDLDKILISKST